MAAAVSKLMRVQDLIAAAAKMRVVTRFRTTVGLPGRLSARLQPNHPTDDAMGIAASILDGLLLGSGDAVIGINPAGDNVAELRDLLRLVDTLRERFGIPAQSCVLAHVTTQMAALEAGAPVDLIFQSIAGTEAANRSFGVNLELLEEAHQAGQSLHRALCARMDVSARTSCTSRRVRVRRFRQTRIMASTSRRWRRARMLWRGISDLCWSIQWLDLSGPSIYFDGKQIVRAGLEDHFCGKLLGLPMGCDVCYTNHAEADQDDMDALLTLLGAAGVNYIMGVPGADDVMLNYQSTSFHDALYLRRVLGLRPRRSSKHGLRARSFTA